MCHLLPGSWAADVMTEQIIAFMHYIVFLRCCGHVILVLAARF